MPTTAYTKTDYFFKWLAKTIKIAFRGQFFLRFVIYFQFSLQKNQFIYFGLKKYPLVEARGHSESLYFSVVLVLNEHVPALSKQRDISVLRKGSTSTCHRLYFVNIYTQWLRRTLPGTIPSFVNVLRLEQHISPSVKHTEIL